MTLNELSYDLLERVRAELSDDEYIDIRQIEFWIHNQRALWLRNELNKKRTISPEVIQDLGCVELELADASACADVPVGCSLLRTKLVIPTPIELHSKLALTRIGPLDQSIPAFTRVHYNEAMFAGNGRFNKQQVFAYYHNERVYLKFNEGANKYAKMLEYINVRGVFEDPTEVSAFTDSTGAPCYDSNSEYPLHRHMYNYMKDAILKSDLQLSMNLPTDNTNNAGANLQSTANG